MASGYQSNGTDLDDLFAARVTTKRADVNFDVSSVDISNRYETLLRDQRIPDITGYTSASTNLAQMFMGDLSQYSVTSKLTSTRTTQWNVQLIHEFTITFTNATERTNFFTFGGRIRSASTRGGGSVSAKNTDWTNLLSAVGMIELAKTATYQNDSIQVSAIGSDDLTASWQTLYTKAGTGAYTTNSFQLQAYEPSTSQIRMRAIYTDGTSGIVDEFVDGTIESFIHERRHPTELSPTFATITNLTSGS